MRSDPTVAVAIGGWVGHKFEKSVVSRAKGGEAQSKSTLSVEQRTGDLRSTNVEEEGLGRGTV